MQYERVATHEEELLPTPTDRVWPWCMPLIIGLIMFLIIVFPFILTRHAG
jgi:hypothetical protein